MKAFLMTTVLVLGLGATTFALAAETCCDKAKAAGKECAHPCCVAATKVNSVCFKCNAGATAEPFNGKDLEVWQFKDGPNKWTVGKVSVNEDNPAVFVIEPLEEGETGAMINDVTGHGQSRDIYSEAKFGDCRIELELMVTKGANSGIYVMGEYEIQVLDSYGKETLTNGDMGAVYGASAPPVNACKKPGEWQTYVIDWQAPKFDESGKKIANAKFIKIELNGKTLHEDLEMKNVTPGGVTGKEAATGPIMFQGDHGAVAYRNIRITHVPAAN